MQALEDLLDMSVKFAKVYNVMFNAKKTMCIRIGWDGKPPKVGFKLNGTTIIENEGQILW